MVVGLGANPKTGAFMSELGSSFVELVYQFWQFVVALWRLLAVAWTLPVAVLVAWVAWWTFAVRWRQLWPELRAGAWAPLVLLTIIAALVWAMIVPSAMTVFGVFTIPNFWWQLCCTTCIAGLALFCGWLQTVFGLEPGEVSFEPPPSADAGHH